MRLLAASDLHIGRIPSLPDQSHAVTGCSAWEALIQCALDYKVDALLLAGDVVQADNAWLEAFGALLPGLARLKEAGIQVVAVAGNHDAEVFPRVGQYSDAMIILGQQGRWESYDLGRVRITGWSFPGSSHTGNPLRTFPAGPLPPGFAHLGLLHCDLDAPAGSPYAPVASAELQAAPVDLWVLGHIHKGGPQAGAKAVYCGSPVALHLAEEGPHGAWLLEVDAHGHVAAPVRVALSPWDFRTLRVDLDQVTTRKDALERISAAMLGAILEQPAPPLVTLYCSLHLPGDCALSGSLETELRADLERAGELVINGVKAKATLRIHDATNPLLDLDALATEHSLEGSLARLILQARDPEAPLDELPDLVSRVLRLNPQHPVRPELAREWVSLAARRLLTAVHSQKRGA